MAVNLRTIAPPRLLPQFNLNAAVAIRLRSTYTGDDDYILEFFLPINVKAISEQQLLLNNLSGTMERICTSLRTISDAEIVAEESKVECQKGNVPNSLEMVLFADSDINSDEPIGNNEIEIVKEADHINKSPFSRVKRRKLTSNVWEEFHKEKDKDGNGLVKVWAICSHCKKKFDGSSKKGTTHLRNHLNRCKSRGTKVMRDQELIVPAGRASENHSIGEVNSSFDQERSRMDVARMIIKHQYPLNIVEDEFFSIFLKNLQPMFKLQSQEALSSDILCVYREEKGRLIEYFDKISCRLNLTISLWTCELEKITYCCFAVQFVDDNWVLKRKIIAFKTLGYEKLEARTFVGDFKSLLVDWNFDKKLCSLSIHNSTSSSLDIAEEIRKSWPFSEASYPLSTFYISFDGHITNLLAKYKSGDQLDYGIIKISSSCLLDIHGLYKKTSQQECRDYPLMNVTSEDGWRRTCSLVLAIAAILDPQFKFDLVEFSYNTIYGHDSAGIHLALIRHTLTNIFNEYASKIHSRESPLDDTNSLASSPTAEGNTMESFQRWYSSKRKASIEASELDKYLQEPVICPEREQFDVLGWWGKHASKFPIIGRMARDILAIPLPTIISGYSSNENVIMDNPIYEGLDPQIIEAMICCKNCTKLCGGKPFDRRVCSSPSPTRRRKLPKSWSPLALMFFFNLSISIFGQSSAFALCLEVEQILVSVGCSGMSNLECAVLPPGVIAATTPEVVAKAIRPLDLRSY
ncbi:putative Zinc finger, BED-type [Corchorus capsularis]|uniref:Putative Zinc finger, BED-type n=1 Tax=Corchorus capsularis TaxID=210143 RepID=A0A1R3IZE1_COCAP|nr:putative Zinc finger, BED-type [Corchorus capsularis]